MLTAIRFNLYFISIVIFLFIREQDLMKVGYKNICQRIPKLLEKTNMRIIITGGGTGGHIYPALAFLKYLEKVEPDTEVLYIGTKKAWRLKLSLKQELN